MNDNISRLDGARGRDGMLMDLAEMQHRAVSRADLIAIGFTRSAIAAAVRSGRLHPVHRAVYAVGTPRLDIYGRMMAAVLAFGDGDAVVSHQSAGVLYEIHRYDGPIHVTTSHEHADRHGIVVHESRATDRRLRTGIPVTTPQRTLIDLADVLTQDGLDAAVSEAHVQRFIDRAVPNRPGRRAVSPGHQLTRSQIERTYLRMVRAAPDLPRPETNVQIGRWQADAYYPGHKVAIEFDDWTTHGSQRAFERDRRKGNDFTVGGIRLARVTPHTLDTAVELTRRLLSHPGII